MSSPSNEPYWVGVFQIACAEPYHYRPVLLDLDNLPKGITVDLEKGVWSEKGMSTFPERRVGIFCGGSSWDTSPTASNLAGIFDIHNIDHLKELVAINYTGRR